MNPESSQLPAAVVWLPETFRDYDLAERRWSDLGRRMAAVRRVAQDAATRRASALRDFAGVPDDMVAGVIEKKAKSLMRAEAEALVAEAALTELAPEFEKAGETLRAALRRAKREIAVFARALLAAQIDARRGEIRRLIATWGPDFENHPLEIPMELILSADPQAALADDMAKCCEMDLAGQVPEDVPHGALPELRQLADWIVKQGRSLPRFPPLLEMLEGPVAPRLDASRQW